MMIKEENSLKSIFKVILVVMLSLGFGVFAMSGIEIYTGPDGERERSPALKEAEIALRRASEEMEEAARQAHQAQMAADPVYVIGEGGAVCFEGKKMSGDDVALLLYGAENAARMSEHFLRDMEEAQRLAFEMSLPTDSGSLVAGENGAMEAYVDKFDKIIAYGCAQIQYQRGAFTGKVEIFADDNSIGSFSVAESGGTLNLRCWGGGSGDNIIVKVTAPALSEVTLFDTSTFSTVGMFDFGKKFHLRAYGVANANFGEIRGDSMEIDAYSACRVYALAVDVDRLDVSASSASHVRLKGLNSGGVTASALSAADVTLGGRCNSLSSTELSEGKVNARGLIVGANVRTTEEPHEMEMPRSPL